MKIAVYPGSFNPWHDGHEDVVMKALKSFDHVVIAQGMNPEKSIAERERIPTEALARMGPRVTTAAYKGLFVDFVEDQNYDAVIKGLRNADDFEYEKIQQYWNEDLGLEIPVFYVISDRTLVHYSSTAMRIVNKLKK